MAAKVDIGKCTGCGSCVEMCPVQAIKVEDGKAVINENCVECGVCLNECTFGAINI